MFAPAVALPTVVYAHREQGYVDIVKEFYQMADLPLGPIFVSNLEAIHCLAQEGQPFILIMGHFPGSECDALFSAEWVKKTYGDLVLGVYAHTIESISTFGDLDGVIPKALAGSGDLFTQICHIIADMSMGVEREELFNRHPEILRN